MSQEGYKLQADQVSIRLVQLVPQLQAAGMPVPSGPGVPPQVSVLGVQYVASWPGLNGPRGWSVGQMQPQLYQEGTASLTLPNDAGEDGVLHRRRLLITSTGKLTPQGGNVVSYAGGAFRPGDEYIEIYRGTPSSPGKVLFILAITKATITSGEITVEGYDALWLLKKQRETAAGIFTNSPRDIIEHYTKAWQAVVADDFPQDGRFVYNSLTPATTTDGLWSYVAASNVPGSVAPGSTWTPALGTSIRLGRPGGFGYINALDPVFLAVPDAGVRWEARFRWIANSFNQSDQVVFGFATSSQPSGDLHPIVLAIQPALTSLGPPGTVQASNGSGENYVNAGAGFVASGWHTVAIEARDRYLFYYFDGKLVAVLPQLGPVDPETTTGRLAYLGSGATFGSGGVGTIDVDYLLLRQLTPAMMRSADTTKFGDYTIGGAPASGSAALEVWRTDDLPVIGNEFSPGRISQFIGRSLSTTLAFGASSRNGTPDWWPPNAGLWYATNWAARATGALFIDLTNFDYRLRLIAQVGARLWVGKTRMGEQILDGWEGSPHHGATGRGAWTFTSPFLKAATFSTPTLAANSIAGATSITLSSATFFDGVLLRIGNAAPYEYAWAWQGVGAVMTLRDPLQRAHSIGDAVVGMNQRSLLGQPTGWYPFILEFLNDPGVAADACPGCVLQYERSDIPGFWNNVGSSAYLHTVWTMVHRYSDVVQTNAFYWPLNEGIVSNASPGGALNYRELVHGTNLGCNASDGLMIATTSNTVAPGDCAPLLNTPSRAGDYIYTATSIPLASPWTVSALFRVDALHGSGWSHAIMCKELSLLLAVDGVTGALGVTCGTGAAYTTTITGPVVLLGAWHHAVVTYDGATIRLYLDGAQVGTASTAGLGSNSNILYFGVRPSVATSYFSGSIAHTLVLPQTMTAADVSVLYQAVTSAPAVPMSDSGIVDSTQQPYRFVSHYDQLLQTVTDWGMQITTEPMQLESGEFPGRLRPLVRVGRDTEFKVGSPQVRKPTSSDIQDAITAEEVADALVADAQGLADPTGATQVAAEIFNFSQLQGVPPGSLLSGLLHPWISSEYDQSNDISYPDLLRLRLISLLALRGAPWEQISLSHEPGRQILDSFPLTGALAEFAWAPGDGVRLEMPELGIIDEQCRQILGVQWPITPAGLGAPAISLRQRPRNFAQTLRDMFREQRTANRTYQRQIAISNGNVAGSGMDIYSRVNLPNAVANVIKAELVVQAKTDTSTWTIEINDVATTVTFSGTGRFDVSAFVGRLGGAPRMYARATGGTGSLTYQLELQIAV